jgi:hypothetical protein
MTEKERFLATLLGGTAVRRAVMDAVPPLLESGRCLPCLDDRPRENTSFSLYSLYHELLAELALLG